MGRWQQSENGVGCRLVLVTSKHIAGLLEAPMARLNGEQASESVQQAAQAISWEDWGPLEGGAQFAQGVILCSKAPSPLSIHAYHHAASSWCSYIQLQHLCCASAHVLCVPVLSPMNGKTNGKQACAVSDT